MIQFYYKLLYILQAVALLFLLLLPLLPPLSIYNQ